MNELLINVILGLVVVSLLMVIVGIVMIVLDTIHPQTEDVSDEELREIIREELRKMS